MQLKIKATTFAFLMLYLIFIWQLVICFKTLMSEATAFEEKVNETHTKMPSFTICPEKVFHKINSFEDAMVAIDNAKFEYSTTLEKSKSFSNR